MMHKPFNLELKNIKRKLKTIDKTQLLFSVIVLFLLILLCIGINYLNSLKMLKIDQLGADMDVLGTSERRKEEAAPEYLTETCFDGTKELDPILFRFPFKKSDFYISNKELIKQLGDEKIEDLQARANDFVTDFYGMNIRTLLTDYQETENKLLDYFIQDNLTSYYDEAETEKSARTYVADYLKFLSDSNLQTDISFETDKSLVFEDFDGFYVRGLLNIKVYEYENNSSVDELNFYSPFPLEKGKTYKIILDLAFIPQTSRTASTYKVSNISVVSWNEII